MNHNMCLQIILDLSISILFSHNFFDLVRVTSRPRELCLRRHFGDHAVGISVFAQHSDMAYIQIKL